MTSKPWWLTETYDQDAAIPTAFEHLAGPHGIALVRHWPSGKTDPGWGLQGADGAEGFIPRYGRGEFSQRRVLYGYSRDKWAFAFVMRSLNVVCIDIDGKNGGIEHAKRLGKLPRTLAETSKSGDGFHLFYYREDAWDPQRGFGSLADRIGVEQGVDIRATGCVYHYPQQRWNDQLMVELPDHLHEMLLHREQLISSTTERINKVLSNNDDLEVLMLHDEILSDLAKPILPGKRNVTLFAIGNQMRQAVIPDWEEKLATRALAVGLDQLEVDQLIRNIGRYGSPVTP